MYLVHVADFLQHGGAPGIVARYLDAAVACGRRGEDGRTVVIKHHGAALGQREETVALHGVDDGQRVPHLLTGVAVAYHIYLLDGMLVSPRNVCYDLLRQVLYAVASLHGVEDDIDIGGPEAEESLGKVHALKEVVVGFGGNTVGATLNVEALHLTSHQLHARQRGIGVADGLQQLGEAGYKSDGADAHRVVGLCGEQTAVKQPAVGKRRVVDDAVGEHRCAVGIFEVGQSLVVDPYLRLFDTITHQADGNIAAIEVRIHHIGTGGTFLALAVHHHAEQLAASLLLIVIEHLQGEEVVGGRAYVCIEDDQRNARVVLFAGRIVII